MRDTDTNPKPQPLPAAKQVVEVIKALRAEFANRIADLEREIRIYRKSDERLVEILNNVGIAEEATPVATGSGTMPALRPGGLAERVGKIIDQGKGQT